MRADDSWGLGPDDNTEAGVRRRMLQMLQEGGCRQPNEVLAAARRLFQDGELGGMVGLALCGPACVGQAHVGTPLAHSIAQVALAARLALAFHNFVLQGWIPRGASSPQMC